MKIWTCPRQITLTKIYEICLSAISKQISTISMHTPSLVKNHWYLLKLTSRNEKKDLSQQKTLSKIDKICPLTIPNQISTTSMHTPSLVKIHWYLLKLSSGNEHMDGRTDIRMGILTRGTGWGYSFDLSLIFLTRQHQFLTPQSKFNPTMTE